MFLPRKRPQSQPKNSGSASSSIVAAFSEIQQSEKPKNPFAAYKAFKAEVKAEQEAKKRLEAEEAAKASGRPSDNATSLNLEDWDPNDQLPLPESVLEEFRLSAIPDRLTHLNIEWHQGVNAVMLLAQGPIESAQKQNSFVGQAIARTLKKYEYLAAGLWATYGTTIDGEINQTVSVKPVTPREGTENKGFGWRPTGKKVKYDAPLGSPALPILPFVDRQTAQEIFDKFGVTPLEGEHFWQTVQRCGLPIIVTEGVKKALALIAHRYPAIALRGITVWHTKGEKTDLHPGLVEFATTGRKIHICFDQDLTPKTVKNVSREINNLGKELKRRGCLVSVMCWQPSEGKGIDDAIYNAGANGQKWLDAVIAGALDLKEWQQNNRIPLILSAIVRAKTLGIEPLRATEGDYLPDLDPLLSGTITIIQAATGSGKTTQFGRIVSDWIERGGNVLVLYSLNGLGQQSAASWGLPHIHDYERDRASQEAYLADISSSHGTVLCIDSLHRIPDWFYNRPLLLVFDECNQDVRHLVQGGTLKERSSEILQLVGKVAKIAAQSGAIIAAEATVFPHTVEFLKAVSGGDHVNLIDHKRTADRGRVEVHQENSPNGLLADAFDRIERGEKLLWLSTSQKNTRKMFEAFTAKGLRAVRIDSDTNREGQFTEFFENPDKWLAENGDSFDVLILSPSCKTGVSITWAGFDQIYGYFPCLDPDSALQMLARYRLPVPRKVAIPKFILTTGDESLGSISKIAARTDLNAKFAIAAHNLDFVESADSDQAAVAAAAVQFAAADSALIGLQKSVAFDYLCETLEVEGFTVYREIPDGTPLPPDDAEARREAKELLEEVTEKIWRDDARAIAVASPFDSVEAANKVLADSCSLADWFRAKKTKLIHERPGIDFNDSDVCYDACTRNDGIMLRGVQTQEDATDPDLIAAVVSGDVERLLSQGLLHKLPTRYLKALIYNKSGILNLLDPEAIYQNSDQALIAVQKFAVKHKAELRYLWGFQVEDQGIDRDGRATTHSPIDVVGKLLKRLGLRFLAISRKGKGQKERQYKIVPRFKTDRENPAWNVAEATRLWAVRSALLKAAEQVQEQACVSTPEPEQQKPPAPKPTPVWTPNVGETVWAWDYDSWTEAVVTAIDSAGRWLVDLVTGWDLAISNPSHLAPIGGAV